MSLYVFSCVRGLKKCANFSTCMCATCLTNLPPATDRPTTDRLATALLKRSIHDPNAPLVGRDVHMQMLSKEGDNSNQQLRPRAEQSSVMRFVFALRGIASATSVRLSVKLLCQLVLPLSCFSNIWRV